MSNKYNRPLRSILSSEHDPIEQIGRLLMYSCSRSIENNIGVVAKEEYPGFGQLTGQEVSQP